jgi:hypothetical protein
MKHTVEHLRFPETMVEAIAEFYQITGQVLGAIAMMDTKNISFDIGDQITNPRQNSKFKTIQPIILFMYHLILLSLFMDL